MCRPKLIPDKSKEDLKKMKGIIVKLLDKQLKQLSEANGSDTTEIVKEFIKRENELMRIERTLINIQKAEV